MTVKNGTLASLAAIIGMGVSIAATPAFAQSEPVISHGVELSEAKITTLADGLEHPWGMAWLPDGSMLITERPGRLRLMRDGALVEQPITGTPDVFAADQGGLLDVAVHPD
ncbi:MAG: PQQ-dependent sugar dehydrogenase, partial [Rhodospirillales bacterium]|nr:PQQ-dependent sugar dehydrogenase [Rhodospirillales bacterium]